MLMLESTPTPTFPGMYPIQILSMIRCNLSPLPQSPDIAISNLSPAIGPLPPDTSQGPVTVSKSSPQMLLSPLAHCFSYTKQLETWGI